MRVFSHCRATRQRPRDEEPLHTARPLQTLAASVVQSEARVICLMVVQLPTDAGGSEVSPV